MYRNCSKFPEVRSLIFSVVKVLLTRAFDLGLKRVSFVTGGKREDDYTWSRKLAMLESFLYFSKSILKSPIRITCK